MVAFQMGPASWTAIVRFGFSQRCRPASGSGHCCPTTQCLGPIRDVRFRTSGWGFARCGLPPCTAPSPWPTLVRSVTTRTHASRCCKQVYTTTKASMPSPNNSPSVSSYTLLSDLIDASSFPVTEAAHEPVSHQNTHTQRETIAPAAG